MKYSRLWKAIVLLCTQACFTPAHAAPTKPQSGGSYTVKRGDTFAKIARNRGISLSLLLQANHIANPHHIELGQRIVIPGARPPRAQVVSEKPAAPLSASAIKQLPAPGSGRRELATTTVNVTPPARRGSWTVRSGDTLSRIQRETGTPVSSLMRLNGLAETSILHPGQTLRTSGAAAAQKTVAAVVKPGRFLQETETPRIMELPAEHPIVQPANDRVPVIADRPAPLPATGTAPHKIESGETFSSIRRLYGLSEAQLVSANRGVNPGRLRVGQTIQIPGQPVRKSAKPVLVRADGRVLAERLDPLALNSGGDSEIPPGRTRTGYLVADGETLDQLARRFHTTEGALRSLNRLGDSDNIYPGRYILVPFIQQAPAPAQLARGGA